MLYRQGKPPGAELGHLCMGAKSKRLGQILIIAGDIPLSRLQLPGRLLWGKILLRIPPLLGKMVVSLPDSVEYLRSPPRLVLLKGGGKGKAQDRVLPASVWERAPAQHQCRYGQVLMRPSSQL